MLFDGERLNIAYDLKFDELNELKEFIISRLDYIEAIGCEDDGIVVPASTALMAFLISVKKTKPSIKIDLLENSSFDMGKFGKAYWICHE
ncbi:MAG: hypothetical protein RL154_832 [Pseudomonadota bacterium]|jgi:hypothetical protein